MCVEKYCLPAHYDERELPKSKLISGTVDVKLEFNDLEILVVNDIDFTVTLRVNLGIHWNEPRIIALENVTNGTDVRTPLDIKFMDHLWFPDLEILHLKQIKDYHVLKKLAGTYLCIYPYVIYFS